MDEFGKDLTKEEIREAVARGWAHPETEKKDMDVVLAEAITKEIFYALYRQGDPQAQKEETKIAGIPVAERPGPRIKED